MIFRTSLVSKLINSIFKKIMNARNNYLFTRYIVEYIELTSLPCWQRCKTRLQNFVMFLIIVKTNP